MKVWQIVEPTNVNHTRRLKLGIRSLLRREPENFTWRPIPPPFPHTRTLHARSFSPAVPLSRTAPAAAPDDTSLPTLCADIRGYATEYRGRPNPPSQMVPSDGSIPVSAPYQCRLPTRRPLATCKTLHCRSWR